MPWHAHRTHCRSMAKYSSSVRIYKMRCSCFFHSSQCLSVGPWTDCLTELNSWRILAADGNERKDMEIDGTEGMDGWQCSRLVWTRELEGFYDLYLPMIVVAYPSPLSLTPLPLSSGDFLIEYEFYPSNDEHLCCDGGVAIQINKYSTALELSSQPTALLNMYEKYWDHLQHMIICS